MFGKFFRTPTYDKVRNGQAEKNLFIRRALIAFLGVLALTGILLGNLYQLQILEYDAYQTRSNGNRIKLLPVPPTRGVIYDRNGKVLAENLTYFGLYIIPEKAENLEKTLDDIRALVGLSDEELEQFSKERKRSSRYTPILLKPNLNEEQMARFAVNQHHFPSVDVHPYFKRNYPYGDMMTHILGYVAKINDKDKKRLEEEESFGNYAGTTDIGKLGIEKYYEKQLHGTTGFEEVEINNRGKVIRKLRDQPAIAGGSIRLTIDIELQRQVTNLLSSYKGAVVVMDPKDSSILAMVTNPSYNNNLFVDGISYQDYQTLLNDPERPLYSRATQGTYPPASTVKPYIAVAGLSENKITPHSTVFDPGYWILPNTTQRFRDWKKTGHGQTDINKAITESSDTYFYQLAYDMGIDKLSHWMNAFGFGMPTGLDLYEESKGIMPTREWKQKQYKKPWVQGDTVNSGIGQGFWTATPLQVAKATAILINNGKVYTPHLMKEVLSTENKAYEDPKLYEDIQGVPNRFWQVAKLGMYNVLNASNGTGKKAFLGTSYKAAGKTGTAQVFSLKGKDYDKHSITKNLHDHSWFVGYAPYENPQVIVSVILENAGGGSAAAAPLARQVMDYVLDKPLQNTEQNRPLASEAKYE